MSKHIGCMIFLRRMICILKCYLKLVTFRLQYHFNCTNYSYNDHSKERYLFFRKYFLRSPDMLFNNHSSAQNEHKSWKETFQFRQSIGGNLPIIRSKQEMFHLLNFMKTYILPVEGIYIGLYMDGKVTSQLNPLFKFMYLYKSLLAGGCAPLSRPELLHFP